MSLGGDHDLRDQRKPPDPDPVGLNDNDAAVGKIALDRPKIGEQHLRLLLWSALCAVAKQHDGG